MALGKIKADTLEHSTAGSLDTQFVVRGSVKVWHNQTADGQTLKGSFNVSSLSDLATGNYQVHISNSLNDANYSGSLTMYGDNREEPFLYDFTTSSYKNYVYDGTYQDGANVTAIFGDLA